jgi:probable F420-dependent oxidoreductase
VIAALGAGWNRPEYHALGIPFDPIGVRVGRLTEAVAVLRGCFAGEPFSFAGHHYTVTDHTGLPTPVQRPGLPLMIGGGGRRVLSLAGREADIVSLAPRTLATTRTDGAVGSDPRSITVAATEEKLVWVREAAGDRFDALELNVYPTGIGPRITDDPRGAAREVLDDIRARTGVELAIDDYLASPNVMIGSVDGLVAKFRELRERLGISTIMTGDLDALAPVVERLAGT